MAGLGEVGRLSKGNKVLFFSLESLKLNASCSCDFIITLFCILTKIFVYSFFITLLKLPLLPVQMIAVYCTQFTCCVSDVCYFVSL